MKRITRTAVLILFVALALTGCKKEEEPTGPVDQVLAPITADMLEPGFFYVKSGDSFYLLPAEDCNFDAENDHLESTDFKENGMVGQDLNRLLSFTWTDDAIPTLYKNDQLIYVAAESIPSFRWERYTDKGYSIGVSGLLIGKSGKVTSGPQSKYAYSSSFETALTAENIEATSGFTVDSINNVTLGENYLNDAGVISGLSKNSQAVVNVFVGTQLHQITAAADTRYFKSFELYETSKYALSTGGYAIVDVPSYFKSGYYLINNYGFVKFINADRGMDESTIDLTTPYFYASEEGKTLTFFEWQEANGIYTGNISQDKATKDTLSPDDFNDKYVLNIDSTQQKIDVNIAYKYNSPEAEEEAARVGQFPKAFLVDSVGNYSQIKANDGLTYDSNNTDGYTYLTASSEGIRPGTWYILFSDFQNITKSVQTDISSGNSTTYVHQGNMGEITIYYEKSDIPHDFVLTWEKSDRSAKSVSIRTPDGLEYSPEKTPGNIMSSEAGRYVIKLPNIVGGDYKFTVTGDDLGRVWVNSQESVYFNSPETPETEVAEGDPLQESSPAEEESESAPNGDSD